MEDLLDLTDRFLARRDAVEVDATPEAAFEPQVEEPTPDLSELPTHWVCHNHRHHTATVHTASCTNCRDGRGKWGVASAKSVWTPYCSFEAAKAGAEQIQPRRNFLGKMCVGDYNEW